ncbi:fatty acyl-AMP ligase [Nocardia colli]|uniref:fatty acyl-AMP ligase n=1 Tax=Nocardia colli TaxID=2545717 RepID=UPI00168D5FA5|nr:fatty acyl-AMP ligase [Nocardia colli]
MTPDNVAYRFLVDGTAEQQNSFTYRELWYRALGVSGQARAAGLTGTRVILAVPPGLDYVAGLFGLIHAGVTVVPTFPLAGRRAVERLSTVLSDSSPAAVIVAADGKALSGLIPDSVPVLPVTTHCTVEEPPFHAADPVLLQYTSGSTGDPKGVVLTQENLMSNCEALTCHVGVEAGRTGLTWLPPYHDMGLIGTIVFALYGGWPLVMMSPEHFVQRPARWLEAIGAFHATITVAPAFALDLCCRMVTDDERAGLDLTSLRQLFCGSEPILPGLLDNFSRRFAGRGLSRDALIPCYGLAEATLFVTGRRPGDRLRVEDGVLSCGVPAAGHEVLITDPATGQSCPEGEVGEIGVRGPNVAAGYFGDRRRTASVFRAGPHGDALRTGDLGYLHDGELFVTGRISGVIVVAGRNLHPQDVEATVNGCHDLIYRSVAFGVPGAAGEDLVVMAEFLGGDAEAARVPGLRGAVVAAVAARHGVRPREVGFTGLGRIPTTTSGKLRRGEARRRYLEVTP